MIDFRHLLPIGLSATILGLGGIIGLEVFGWQQDTPVSPLAQRVAVPGASQRSDAVSTTNNYGSWLNQILARPLFSPTRRPVETGVTRSLPRLTGIVVTETQRLAIFAGPSNEHPIVAQVGTHVGAYDVQTITDTGVTVVGPEGVTLIKPIFDANRPASPPTPVPGRPQTPPPRPAAR